MTSENGTAASFDWLEEWVAWLEGDLFDQIHRLVRQREVFKSWNELVEAAAPESKVRGLFHAWVNENYVTSIAVGVRRMCDRNPQTRSLVRLLTEIKENTAELTYDWWAGRWWPSEERPPAHYLERFTELSSGGDHVDPDVIQTDLERLTDVCLSVKQYVDKYVAHLDSDRRSLDAVTLSDVHGAVDTVYEVFHRWYELVPNVVLSVPLAEPWEHGFTVPWITDAQAAEILGRREAESTSLESRLRSNP